MADRILIVEDAAAMREVITDFLTGVGYDCTSVSDGNMAIEQIQSNSFDLILTDLRMPGQDGFAVVEAANTHQPDTPKVIMTAHSQIEDTLRAIKLGAYDFIRKPIPKLEELGVVLHRALEHRRLIRERQEHLSEIERINQELSHLNEHLEDEVERRAGALAKANQELRTLDEMKNNLLANISHELRTPLVSVRGYTELFYTGHFCPIPEDKKAYLETCLRNIDKLLHLIESLVRYADMVRDKVPELELTQFNLCEFMKGVVADYQAKAEEVGIPLMLTASDIEFQVRCDRQRLRQVMEQIFDNAFKFNKSGCEINVMIESLGRRIVKISVVDTGIGIPLDAQVHIFDRFFQVDSGPTRQHGGTGMGLAIARDNLRLMGSELRVNSEPGKGSSFFWTMPMVPLENVSFGQVEPTSQPVIH